MTNSESVSKKQEFLKKIFGRLIDDTTDIEFDEALNNYRVSINDRMTRLNDFK